MNLKNTILRSVGNLSQKRSGKVLKYICENYRFDPNLKRFSHRKKIPVQILIYHRVLPFSDPFAIDVMSKDLFEAQIKYISYYFNIISLGDLVDDIKNENIKPYSLCITFDDGYIDNYQHAFPVLQKYKAPATIFLTSDYISTNEHLWFDKALNIIKNSKKNRLDMSNYNRPDIDLSSLNAKKSQINGVLEWLKSYSPVERDSIIEYMQKESEVVDKIERKMLNWDEVREMSSAGISFGSHTRSHPILSSLSLEQIEREITGSKEIIEGNLDKEITTFAYPNGKENDYNNSCFEVLSKSGYQAAVTTSPGNNYQDTNLLQLRRFKPWDYEATNFIGKIILSRFLDN